MSSQEESKASTSEKKDQTFEAMNNFFQGKRHLLVKDYTSAADSLQLACEQFIKLYGNLSKECADVHFYYGKALLEISRIENGVIENAAIEEQEEEKEDSDEENQEDEGNQEEEENGEKQEGGEEENKEEVKDASPGEDLGEDSSSGKEEEAAKTNKDKELKKPQEGEEDDEHIAEGAEISSLQLAWEVLETAKVIYEKNLDENPQFKKPLVETMLALGEVSMESDLHSQAVSDFLQCLCIQKEILPPDSRCLALTFYNLGLAYSFDKQFTSAVSSFKECLKILQLRIKNLKVKIEKGEALDDDDDPFNTPQKELEEIEGLLPEIESKIEDEELSSLPSTDSSKKIIASEPGASSSASASSSFGFSSSSSTLPSSTSGFTSSAFGLKDEEETAKPIQTIPIKRVNDITSLVKRKTDNSDQNGMANVKKKARLE